MKIRHFKVKVPTYDIKVNIVLFDTMKQLKRWWKKQGHNMEMMDFTGGFKGMCIPLKSGDYTILLKREGLELETVMHEVIHVRQFLFSNLGMYNDRLDYTNYALMESEAYFTASLANRIHKKLKWKKEKY